MPIQAVRQVFMGVYVLVSRLSPAPIHTKNGLFTGVSGPKVRNKLLFGTEFGTEFRRRMSPQVAPEPFSAHLTSSSQ